MTATEAAHVAPRAGGALDALGGRVRSVAAIGEKGRRQHALGLAPQLGQGWSSAQSAMRTISRNDPQSLQK